MVLGFQRSKHWKKKKGNSSGKKRKNADLKAKHYGSRKEMKIQSFFVDMPTTGGVLI